MDNLRRFVVVVTVIIFLALGGTGFILSLRYNSVSVGLTEPLTVESNPVNINTDKKQRDVVCENILIAVGDFDKEETILLMVVNIDTVSDDLTFLFIPKDLEYSKKKDSGEQGEVLKIGTLCHREGIESCASVISSILDISIPYYMQLNEENFVKFFNVFSSKESGIDFDLPVNIKYHDENGKLVTFTKGKNCFTGIDVLNFAKFYKTDDNIYKSEMLVWYNGTDINRIKVFQSFLSEFINSKFILQSEDYYSKNFNALFLNDVYPGLYTNIVTDDLIIVQNYLSRLTKKDVSYYVINGEETINSDYYIKYTDSLLQLTDENDKEEMYRFHPADEIFPEYFNSYK